jgi:predicted dithiol-disulfide oxidoreductase (DUF899 family)
MHSKSNNDHEVVSRSEWLRASRELLEKEKELTRMSDDLARQRLELPWTRVEKNYTFDGAQGKLSLPDLFGGKSQLAVYHFMFGPDWDEGCPSCSYVTDHLEGTRQHLHARDISLVPVSRAPLEKLAVFQKRMGWHLPWVSSAPCDFNHDFGVSFTKDEVASGAKAYNLETMVPYSEENPGMSFFSKDSDGAVFHTYSTYARGLDVLLGAYAILDRAPKGRNEAGLPWPMAWVRYHDKYEPTLVSLESCCQNKNSC